MLKYILQLHQALESWEQAAIETLLAAPVMHVDETSLRLPNTKRIERMICGAEVRRASRSASALLKAN
jgi:hypothetical protein